MSATVVSGRTALKAADDSVRLYGVKRANKREKGKIKKGE